MPSEISHRIDLHRNLKEFYNTDAGYFAEAHEVNSELTPERARLFSWIQPGTRVLDVGCGPGDNGRHLASRTNYVGCDLSSLALRMAHATLPSSHFALGESQSLPFASDSFDVVLSTYALEHLVFARQSLEEMWRVCRNGGLLLLISPAYDDPRQLPPSTSHWTAFQRGLLVARQTWRQLRRHFNPAHFDFTYISQPRVLNTAYQSDFDAVHLVSAREVSNFLRAKGGNVLFERKRVPRPVVEGGIRTRIFEHLRNFLLYFHLGEYLGLNLQIAVVKGKNVIPRQLHSSPSS